MLVELEFLSFLNVSCAALQGSEDFDKYADQVIMGSSISAFASAVRWICLCSSQHLLMRDHGSLEGNLKADQGSGCWCL